MAELLEMVRGRTVTEMRMHHDAEALELVEVAVHRRQVHVGGARLDLRGELFGGAVARAVVEAFEQQPARAGDARAPGTQARQDRLDGVCPQVPVAPSSHRPDPTCIQILVACWSQLWETARLPG